MSKNLIPEIAKLLGVEIGEEFKVRIVDSGNEIKYTFRFTEKYLEYYDNDVQDWEWVGSPMFADFIRGESEIVKIPWKPKHGDYYYSYSSQNWNVLSTRWFDWAEDIVRYKHGLVFRTEEEAIKKRPFLYKEYVGKEWQGEE